MKRILVAAACFCFFGCEFQLANAAEDTVTNEVSNPGLFDYSRYEATLTSGALFSPFIATGGRPTINYTITEVQFGYMLSDVKGHGWSRGNFELVGDGFGSAIFYGSGSYIAGMTIWMRYNFVPQGWRVIPFAQAGMGVTSTDIDRSIVGQPFNFNLDIGIGARYLFSEHWSLNAECRYQHISNANTGEHNIGINSIGPVVGVSYLF